MQRRARRAPGARCPASLESASRRGRCAQLVAVDGDRIRERLGVHAHARPNLHSPMAVALLGVTGFTGQLVLAEARRAGLEIRLAGRRREALDELGGLRGGRVADARDEAALRAAFDGARWSSRSPARSSNSVSRPSGPLPVSARTTRLDRRAGVRAARARRDRGRHGRPRSASTTFPAIGGQAGRGAGRGPARRDRRRLRDERDRRAAARGTRSAAS